MPEAISSNGIASSPSAPRNDMRTSNMKILIIGSGGREHALAWKISCSKRVKNIFCAPGNGGTGQIARNVDIKADDIESLKKFAKDESIDLTIVGPEIPLALGIVDEFEKEGLKIFGPCKEVSRLEASKIFTKELCKEENIPTADFKIFDNEKTAKEYLKSTSFPVVIKADGLAAGKGVIIAKTEIEALSAIYSIMVRKEFGSSGDRIIIEECMEGEEASILVISDGENIVPLASSQDHKRIFDGDKGPNTGGMGAYSPAPVVTEKVFDKTIAKIIKPAILGMKKKGLSYKGVLYAGIMIVSGEPKLVEFNVRFGDPETEAILPRMESDIVELLELASCSGLKNYKIKWSKKTCVSVVMAAGGYPGKYEKGKEITGLKEAETIKDILIFHAGTKNEDTKILTSGGRVLNVVGLGSSLEEAINVAYKACNVVKFEKAYYRKDIGRRALEKRG